MALQEIRTKDVFVSEESVGTLAVQPLKLSLFVLTGGADDIEHLSTSTFGRGIVGCVGQLSVGQMFDVELLQRAGDGRNVDACQDVTDDTFLLNVP